MGGIAIARYRAAGVLGIAVRRSARLKKYHWHQKSCRRCADRESDLRQGSFGAGGRNQGARPRAAVEFLRRAAIYLSVLALRALGPFQPCRAAAEIRSFGPAVVVVVRCRQ